MLWLLLAGLGGVASQSCSVSLLAGSSTAVGYADGQASSTLFGGAEIFSPYQLLGAAVDDSGNTYVADTFNARVRRVTPSGNTSTLAGFGINAYLDDVLGTNAMFSTPSGVAVDAAGTTLFVADTGNSRIRVIDVASSAVTSLAGGWNGDVGGFFDAIGSNALFNEPQGVACRGTLTVVVADTRNSAIRSITVSTGAVVTLAGGGTGSLGYGTPGFNDGTGTSALFSFPSGVAMNAAGTVVWVAGA